MSERRAIVVGAGAFGVAAALSLRARGWSVTLLDPGPLPHPLAASNDISKVVRTEYGDDAFYSELGERSIAGWRAINRTLDRPVFHETGVLFACDPVGPGKFERDSLATLRARGLHPEWLDRASLIKRFPAWSQSSYDEALFHTVGGWVESGRAIAVLSQQASEAGVTLRAGASFSRLIERGSRVVGVAITSGSGAEESIEADAVLIAAGAWTPSLLPELAPQLQATAHPIFHLRPAHPERFTAEHFPIFGAAISETGWYGFPLHPTEGVVKVAHHGVGRPLHPSSTDRSVHPDDLAAMRRFLAETFPELLDAEVVSARVCLYCDSPDGHFWIDQHPARPGLFVASGDSGHGFKFTPALGDLIASVIEGEPPIPRFCWRQGAPGQMREAARSRS